MQNKSSEKNFMILHLVIESFCFKITILQILFKKQKIHYQENGFRFYQNCSKSDRLKSCSAYSRLLTASEITCLCPQITLLRQPTFNENRNRSKCRKISTFHNMQIFYFPNMIVLTPIDKRVRQILSKCLPQFCISDMTMALVIIIG